MNISTIALSLIWCANILGLAQAPCYESVNGDWAHKTLASLTTREKIGQLFVVPTASCLDQPEEALATSMRKSPYKMDPDYIKQLITDYKVGGVIFLYKSTPPLQIAATNEYQKLSKTPLLISQDCEWGLQMRLYDTLRFPRNMTLGALSTNHLIYALGREIGRECKAIGVHMNFSPVVDVNNNPDNPVIHDRSFGEDPHAVADAGLLMMQGLQDEGIIACAKHFPGHGDTAVDSHLNLPIIPHTRERLHQVELVPFKHLIKHGISAVMNAHLAIPALEKEEHRASSLSRAITTQLLEKDLHFTGLKVTDGIGMEALTRHYAPGQIELEAFLAGNDILLCPLDVPRAVELIEKAVADKQVSLKDLDARVLKILKAKEWAGCHAFTPIDIEHARAQLATPQARQLKKQLYQEAITVITPHTFQQLAPTDAQSTVIIQVGGNEHSDFTTTLQKTVACDSLYLKAKGDTNDLDALIKRISNYTTVVVPIFEMNKFSKQQYGIAPTTQALLAALHAQNKRIIIVPFGTPYSTSFFGMACSIICAYEDDVDAQTAAADVLVGRQKATGVLPVTCGATKPVQAVAAPHNRKKLGLFAGLLSLGAYITYKICAPQSH